jgi:uncharacterized OB-fold protein
MKEYKKPLPQITPWSKAFWEGCKRHKLLIQRCDECLKFVMYPKLYCPYCLSPKLKWVNATGKGKIYSFSTVQSYAPTEFAGDVPYVVGIVELEEGVRMMSNIVEIPPEKVKCDMPVQVVFDDVTKEVTLPKFKPSL